MPNQKILGDFQTPISLAHEIFERVLMDYNCNWSILLEPSCGVGNFFSAAKRLNLDFAHILGIDIQSNYLESIFPQTNMTLLHEDIFTINLLEVLHPTEKDEILIIGNPPWVTNSMLGASNATNLPQKTNFKQFKGLDALTGKSNFDIAEYIWIKLLDTFQNHSTTIALICKTSVARNIILYVNASQLSVSNISMYEIDAKKYFNVDVAACLLVMQTKKTQETYTIKNYANLQDNKPQNTIGIVNGQLVSNYQDYNALSSIEGQFHLDWRQGIKHDAAKIMELKCENSHWKNKLGEKVDIESDFIYPLIKSSSVRKFANNSSNLGVIIPQTFLGEDTFKLKSIAPKLWHYLDKHKEIFMKRKSSIYKDKPPFSIFGVGSYSFAQYKVIISGFYKEPLFMLGTPLEGKPLLCDDTCYLLAFTHLESAIVTTALLNHPNVLRFIESISFSDSKRPITKAILQRINLLAVIDMLSLTQINNAIDIVCTKYNQELFEVKTKSEVKYLISRS